MGYRPNHEDDQTLEQNRLENHFWLKMVVQPAITVPKVVALEQLRVRDDAYYDALNNSLVAPLQGEIEEQQEFLATIYKVIEDKLREEEGIYLASDAEVSDIKWQPLAPDADLPSADIISQEWAQTHTHLEFLREQARLNNIAAATWRFWWSANPPNRLQFPEIYAEWCKIEDYCRITTQTWYNIRFKELKEDSAKALGLDLIMFKKITTSTEWLADEFEKAGTDPTYAAQQATARAESARSRSADPIMKSHPSTPDNKMSRTPTLRQSNELSEITSLEYIDEPQVKQESMTPQVEDISTVIVNLAPIRHRTDMTIDENTKLSIYKGKITEAIQMDTSEDFELKTDLVAEPHASNTKDKGKMKDLMAMDTTADFTSSKDSKLTYNTAPSTLSPGVQKFSKGVTPTLDREDKLKCSHTPIQVLSNGQMLLDFMDIAEKHLTRADQVQFHKELDRKGYDARSAYLEVMLDGLFKKAIDEELHQGHYHPIKDVYDNFNDPLEKFEDQVESVEKDKTLFAILPYELYRDLLVH
ncbi:hypothetical protein AX15_006225 [Amanita polypyramis BW_CC]|nr:hypothetical protein AX15_006225 [Amanita polypyramis BW_CC]